MSDVLKKYREQYPAYKDIPDADLAKALHAKFYADMPEADFNKRIGLQSAPTMPPPPDPGFFGRFEDRAGYSLRGEEAPPLASTAGTGAKIADTAIDALDWIRGGAKTATEMMTLGLSDDAAALGTAAGKALKGSGEGFGVDYRKANEAEQTDITRFIRDNPIAARSLQGVGILANPVNAAGAGFVSAGPTLMSRALRSAVPASILGAVSGFGLAEGDLGDKATGGATGGILAAALGPLMTIGGEGIIRGASKASDVVKNVINSHRDPGNQAQRLLAQSLTRDRADIPALFQQAGRDGPESLMDLAGPNTVALGRQATVAPGDARMAATDFFEGRRGDAGQRVQNVLAGLIPENADDEIARLGVQKAAAARPLYAASNAADPETLNTPFVQEVLASPVGKTALQNARKLWEADRLAGRVQGNPFTSVLDAEGNLTLQTAPDMRILDYMKRGMDQMVDEAYGASRTAGNSMAAARDAFRSHLREINPSYGQALDAYSGPSHAQDLMREGMDFFKGRAQEAVRRIGQLQGDDLVAYRIGAVRAAMDDLDNVTDAGSVYAKIGNTQAKRQRLTALFPNRAEFDRVFNRLLAERQMINTERTVMGGSPTSRIDADKADAADTVGLVRNVADAAQGNFLSPVLNMVTGAANRARGINEETAAELGRFLFSAEPQVRQGILSAITAPQGTGPGILSQTLQQLVRSTQRQRTGGGLLGSLTGQSVGTGVGTAK